MGNNGQVRIYHNGKQIAFADNFELKTSGEPTPVKVKEYKMSYSLKCDVKAKESIEKFFTYERYTREEIKAFLEIVEHHGKVVLKLKNVRSYCEELGEGELQAVCDTPRKVRAAIKCQKFPYELYDAYGHPCEIIKGKVYVRFDILWGWVPPVYRRLKKEENIRQWLWRGKHRKRKT